ncbi:MAG: sigma-70 family RNA polymerase sigma factor [Pseudomonadota bacterium]
MFDNNDLTKESEKLKRFAYRLTKNMTEAEDLLQSTILRAIEKKHLFQEGTNLFSWSSKIMYNLFVSAYRRKTKFETQYDPENYIQKEQVDAKQDKKIELEEVRQAMNNLSVEHKQILVMVCVKGMQYAEVADNLDIPIGTVRSRLSRARESLQVELDKTNTAIIARDYSADASKQKIAA